MSCRLASVAIGRWLSPVINVKNVATSVIASLRPFEKKKGLSLEPAGNSTQMTRSSVPSSRGSVPKLHPSGRAAGFSYMAHVFSLPISSTVQLFAPILGTKLFDVVARVGAGVDAAEWSYSVSLVVVRGTSPLSGRSISVVATLGAMSVYRVWICSVR